MEGMVFTKIYDPPSINRKEILRYAGVYGDFPEADVLIDSCIKESEKAFSYKVCFAHFPVRHDGEYIDLGFAKTNSANLRKNLEGCKSAVLFAATIGLGIDRLIARYSKISPAKALIFQSIGAERIEALCEAFVCDIHNECKKNGSALRPRFSPGYGDLPLDVQKNIFDALDCPRKIGLSLNESLLMSPTKSVTAIIGIKE
jgi:cobalamin-dependent methionine synthase I